MAETTQMRIIELTLVHWVWKECFRGLERRRIVGTWREDDRWGELGLGVVRGKRVIRENGLPLREVQNKRPNPRAVVFRTRAGMFVTCKLRKKCNTLKDLLLHGYYVQRGDGVILASALAGWEVVLGGRPDSASPMCLIRFSNCSSSFLRGWSGM